MQPGTKATADTGTPTMECNIGFSDQKSDVLGLEVRRVGCRSSHSQKTVVPMLLRIINDSIIGGGELLSPDQPSLPQAISR
ncbi:hypothetical protein DBV08_17840 [Rhodococcus sp. KBW08]|nr:hypothetical protein DBV08_17840 [Rhodococcus sp. KBW08]